MDIDRPSNTDPQSQDVRARTMEAQQRLVQNPEVAASLRPDYGGLLASSRPENGPRKEDREARERKRSVMAAIARLLHLPSDKSIGVEVQTRADRVTFLIRDLATGDVLREIPEADAREITGELGRLHGGIVDRAL